MIQSRGQFVGRLIEAASLFVLLIVVALRPLIGESYDLAGLAMTSALKGISDPLPLHTLLMDAAILAAALGWAVAKGLDQRRRNRWCGLEVGLVLVVAAAVISCTVANDKRVAINASVDWVSTAAVAIVLAQLLRGRRAVRLALCVIVASAAAQAYRCFDQVLVGFAETERMYQEQREDFWQTQGVPLDSPQRDFGQQADSYRRIKAHRGPELARDVDAFDVGSRCAPFGQKNLDRGRDCALGQLHLAQVGLRDVDRLVSPAHVESAASGNPA